MFLSLLGEAPPCQPAPETAWFDEHAGNGTLPGLVWWWKVNHVDACPDGQRSDALRRWRVLGQMLWCFDEARRASEVPSDAIDRIALELRLPEFDAAGIRQFRGTPGGRPADIARAYMCIRSFRAVVPVRSVAVPVALFDSSEKGDRSGFLATLELELMSDGIGETAPHPGAAFDTIYHSAFDESMARSWQMAVKATTGSPKVDGRWRLRRGAPFESSAAQGIRLQAVDGPSASGAAARGWWYALNDKVPDAEIVVLAQVLPDEVSLGTVDRITEKVHAIVGQGTRPDGRLAFDTIVVVGLKARAEAERALGRNEAGLRVVSLD